jgi:hypothetical protein
MDRSLTSVAAMLFAVGAACRSEPRGATPPALSASAEAGSGAETRESGTATATGAATSTSTSTSTSTATEREADTAALSAFLRGEAVEASSPRRHRDIRAFCTESVKRSTAELREAGGFPHLRPTTPTCRAGTLPVPFTGDAVFKRAVAVVVDSGLSSESRVLVEMADGLEDTPIDWGYRNPSASQSVPYATTLESLRIEGGKLVAIVGREHVWIFPDASGDAGPPEWFLVRGVIACEPGASLSCRSWFTDAQAPWLGMKRRSFDGPHDKTSWDRIAWDHPLRSFAFAPGGGLSITSR